MLNERLSKIETREYECCLDGTHGADEWYACDVHNDLYLISDIEWLINQVRSLRKGLAIYGQHFPSCYSKTTLEGTCNCGLDTTLGDDPVYVQ
jgi:hypothetical protein